MELSRLCRLGLFKEMYAYATPYAYGLNYTAQMRYTGSEVMLFSKRIEATLEALEQIPA